MEKPKSPNPEPAWLDDDRAIQATARIIETIGMKQWPQCSLLNHPKIAAQTPFVLHQQYDDDNEPPTRTYVVPYGLQDEKDEHGTPLTRMCILIDAATGEFEEVTVFGKPVAYITQESAVAVVADALRVRADKLSVRDASRVHHPGEISNVRAYPFWKISVGLQDYYVDQKGQLHDHVAPTKGGS